MDGKNNGIVLYHYSFSPFARRVTWYLTLRGIDYAECKQPPVMPRPDLKALGVKYRRIPLMAIGRDVYCDTRLILRKLEELLPHDGKLGASTSDQKAIEKLLEVWSIEAPVFVRASQLIPTSMPLLNDPKFTSDREDFSGRSWNKDEISKMRPEALTYIRNGFKLLETTLLADGRDWILKTDKPTLADIEAIWAFDWLNGLKDALPKEVISQEQFPKVFAWIKRFNQELKKVKDKAPKPTSLKGDVASQRILAADFVESAGQVDETDPSGFKSGDEIEVWPIDSGFRHRDRGSLLSLNDEEIVLKLDSAPSGKEVRLHCPRVGFRIAPVAASQAKL